MTKHSENPEIATCDNNVLAVVFSDLFLKEIELIKKNIFYNIHDKDKKPIKILRIDISGKLPVADFINAEKVSLLTCIGKPKIHSIYLYYLAVHPDYC
jgi:hypothetical protein